VTLWAVAATLSATVVLAAWAVARRRPEHRPIASLLSAGLVADLARQGIGVYVLQPTRAAAGGLPFTGAARFAFHVDQALFLSWPAALAACAVLVYLGRRPWPVALVYGLAVTLFTMAYPALRGAPLGRAYLGAELAALAVCLGTFITWAWRREAPDLTRSVMFIISAVELVTLLPYRKGPFAFWPLAQASYMTLYVVLIILHGGTLWGRGSSSSSSSH
jgi:hypothetical protein